MSQSWKSVDEALDYAMAAELKAAALYRALEQQAPSAKLKALFARFASEEDGHYRKLARLRQGAAAALGPGGPLAVPRPASATLEARGITDIASAYRYAIRAEKGAARLYATLADLATSPRVRQTFELLMQEELKHRAWLEADLAKREGGGFLRRLFRRATGG
ncbi:MAG TPA: ferritin family protein [Planctomycetota bacterium]|nr:ferritin family protein [Planctomycetota bacterium]HRR80034.1 ferritin family protein [Planctomycetota bacterium]HRT95872.1 ferritin family protein [Planctomycetota bacterium]